ncbi:hypothetical protein DAEQUDRAFT_736903 [Daedalea quercina L-15889]|uniref:Uncharacterized protein n=1 Tax=Daedalea quercina L-15889 TaxID=1314783 RepID=A0A165RR75_9APHY|nr:hypothetical protein DAEQUDRAFT_736903 [Daedalea quercina L-15889]
MQMADKHALKTKISIQGMMQRRFFSGKIRDLAALKALLLQHDEVEQSGPAALNLPPKVKCAVANSQSSRGQHFQTASVRHVVETPDESIDYEVMLQTDAEQLPDVRSVLSAGTLLQASNDTKSDDEMPLAQSHEAQHQGLGMSSQASAATAGPKTRKGQKLSIGRDEIDAFNDTAPADDDLVLTGGSESLSTVQQKRKAVTQASSEMQVVKAKKKAKASAPKPEIPSGVLPMWVTPVCPHTSVANTGKTAVSQPSTTATESDVVERTTVGQGTLGTGSPVLAVRRTSEGTVTAHVASVPMATSTPADVKNGGYIAHHVTTRCMHVMNSCLPSGMALPWYNKVFIPCLVESLGRHDNPWSFQSSPKGAGKVQLLWNEIFPNVELGYMIKVDTPIFMLYWKDCQISSQADCAANAAFEIGEGDAYLYGHVTVRMDGDKLVVDAERAWSLAVKDGTFPEKIHGKAKDRKPDLETSFSEKRFGTRVPFYTHSIQVLTKCTSENIIQKALDVMNKDSRFVPEEIQSDSGDEDLVMYLDPINVEDAEEVDEAGAVFKEVDEVACNND